MKQAERVTVSLGEWDHVACPELVLRSDEDRALAEALREGRGRLLVDEARQGIRLTSRSWVGLVRFEAFDVRIVPKYVGGELGVLSMLERTRGLDALRRVPSVRDLAVEGAHLLDLVALLLAESADRLVRDGLLQDYVTREDTLPVVRGRLLPLEQVTRQPGRLDALECRFDEFETDIPENRLVAAALDAVGRHARHPHARMRVGRMRAVFRDACDASLIDPAWIDASPEYHRRNEHYRDAHLLSRLVLRRLAVRDVYAPGEASSFAFLFDMNRLFEEFVTWLLRRRLHSTSAAVEAQRSDRLVFEHASTGRAYASIRPDMVVRWTDGLGIGQRLPVDAKYKLYDDAQIESADLYQLVIYAQAYAPEDSPGPARALALFPSKGSTRHDIRVRFPSGQGGALISAMGLDLARILLSLERRERVPVPALDAIASMVAPGAGPGAGAVAA
jgi:5-methylcytosine-specific restriction enzyme subunit McrC